MNERKGKGEKIIREGSVTDISRNDRDIWRKLNKRATKDGRVFGKTASYIENRNIHKIDENVTNDTWHEHFEHVDNI